MAKKVLWISDDHKDYEEMYVEKFEETGLDLTLSETFYFDSSFDFVLVDYGLVDIGRDSIPTIRKYYDNGIPLVWTGGFGGGDLYIDDCKRLFPTKKWMHEIRSWELSDVDIYIKNELEEKGKW